MTDTPTTGGTVRYHRAEWQPELNIWHIWWTPDRFYRVTSMEGEAMGLTPPEPEPAPLVVTCNGHSVELDADAVDELIRGWAGRSLVVDTPFATTVAALANLFRDARQKSQPEQDDTASDIEYSSHSSTNEGE